MSGCPEDGPAPTSRRQDVLRRGELHGRPGPVLHRDQAQAARRADRGPGLPLRRPKRQARRYRLTGRAALLALVLCALVVALAYPMRQYISQRADIADQRARGAAGQRSRCEQLREEKARWQDDAYVRAAGPRAAALRAAGGDRLHRASTRARGPGEPPRRDPGAAATAPGTRTLGRRRQRRRGYRPADRHRIANRPGMETAPADQTPRTEPTDADVAAVQAAARPSAARSARGRAPLPVRAARRGRDRPAAGGRHALPDAVLPDVPARRLGDRHAGGERRDEGDDGAAGRADPELAAAYRAAHEDYIARRDAIEVLEGFPSAGGMPDRVKCLHVLVGHSLAAGPGVNPLGDEALAMLPGVVAQGPVRDRSRGRDGPRRTPTTEEARHDAAVAAVDCGTNSIRLLVADVDPRDRRARRPGPADDDRPARPGRGPHRPARPRGAGADLRRLPGVRRGRSRSTASQRLRFVATSASRDAENRDEFVRGVLDILGVEPEVITGDQEAELSFTGATRELTGRDGPRHAVPGGRHRRRLDRVRARRRPGDAPPVRWTSAACG